MEDDVTKRDTIDSLGRKQQTVLSKSIINKLFKLKKIQLCESGICFIFKFWKLIVSFGLVEMFNSININELWKML